MNTKTFLNDIIPTLQKVNPAKCYQGLYKDALMLLDKAWRTKSEDMIQVVTSNFISNIIMPSAAKTLVQEVNLSNFCRPDFTSVPAWYRIGLHLNSKALPPHSYQLSQRGYKGKVLSTSCKNSREKLLDACERIRLEAGIVLHLTSTSGKGIGLKKSTMPFTQILKSRKRVSLRLMERLVEEINETYDVPTAMYLECMLGVRLIQVHLKRGVITAEPAHKYNGNPNGNSLNFMMNYTYGKEQESYTAITLRTFQHPFLMYIDHYYVGATLTDGAVNFSKNLHENNRFMKLYKSPNEAKVTHTAMTFSEFLSDSTLNIVDRVDPNTVCGAYHTLFNAMEFDKSYRWNVTEYMKQHPEWKPHSSLRKQLRLP